MNTVIAADSVFVMFYLTSYLQYKSHLHAFIGDVRKMTHTHALSQTHTQKKERSFNLKKKGPEEPTVSQPCVGC